VQHQAATIACVLEDENDETNSIAVVKDSDLMPLYNVVQKDSVDDVAIIPELSAEQINEVKSLLKEYSSDTYSQTLGKTQGGSNTERTSAKQNISNSIQDGGSNKQQD